MQEDDDLLPPDWEEEKGMKEGDMRLPTPSVRLQEALDKVVQSALETRRREEIEQLNRSLEEDNGGS